MAHIEDNLPASVRYHLGELGVALNPAHPAHILPAVGNARAILDVGGGIGQFFAATRPSEGVLAIVVDIDHAALAFGSRRYGRYGYVSADAVRLPFRNDAFDLLVCRVALPYTDVPRALEEFARVLMPAGRLWVTLHTWRSQIAHLWRSIRGFHLRDVLFRVYVLFNGVYLHAFGRSAPAPALGKHESFQTRGGVSRLLEANGFHKITTSTRNGHFLVTAEKPAGRASCSCG